MHFVRITGNIGCMWHCLFLRYLLSAQNALKDKNLYFLFHFHNYYSSQYGELNMLLFLY